MAEPIIERNSPVPIDHTRIFAPAKDQQETVTVKIYQGESRTAAGNELLGQFEFSGFEPGPRDQVQIEVAFEISTEGIVRVSACDPKTGVEHSTTVSMSSGLSEEEIRAIIERGRAEDVARGVDPTETKRPARAARTSQTSAADDEDEEMLLDLPEIDDAPAGDASNREMFGAAGTDLSESEFELDDDSE